MKIIGLISAYLEGDLLAGAMRSLDKIGLDDLLVYEGPAGPPLEGIPPTLNLGSVFPRNVQHVSKVGRWRTDARKRDEMLQEARRRVQSILPLPTAQGPEPVWGIWLDGDEILVNGEYLRDKLQAVVWNDEAELERDPAALPTIHQPLRVVEADGSIALTNSRVFRVDLVRSIDISVSVVTNEYGIEEAWGNTNPDARLWVEMWMRAVETGRMIAWPPLPCEPHIYHRSNLRHPVRRGLRLHKQEKDELTKAGKL